MTVIPAMTHKLWRGQSKRGAAEYISPRSNGFEEIYAMTTVESSQTFNHHFKSWIGECFSVSYPIFTTLNLISLFLNLSALFFVNQCASEFSMEIFKKFKFLLTHSLLTKNQ